FNHYTDEFVYGTGCCVPAVSISGFDASVTSRSRGLHFNSANISFPLLEPQDGHPGALGLDYRNLTFASVHFTDSEWNNFLNHVHNGNYAEFQFTALTVDNVQLNDLSYDNAFGIRIQRGRDQLYYPDQLPDPPVTDEVNPEDELALYGYYGFAGHDWAEITFDSLGLDKNDLPVDIEVRFRDVQTFQEFSIQQRLSLPNNQLQENRYRVRINGLQGGKAYSILGLNLVAPDGSIISSSGSSGSILQLKPYSEEDIQAFEDQLDPNSGSIVEGNWRMYTLPAGGFVFALVEPDGSNGVKFSNFKKFYSEHLYRKDASGFTYINLGNYGSEGLRIPPLNGGNYFSHFTAAHSAEMDQEIR
ncbi:MAG: hypothetical protein KC649_08130, partial [Candidatus Omnitrophica bacterium]|nr:hypothetical protein [Candidatus Omnitrophota bacterium]